MVQTSQARSTWVALLVLGVLAGCGSNRYGRYTPTPLALDQVEQLAIERSTEGAICPGSTMDLRVSMTLSDGSEVVSQAKSSRAPITDFIFEVSGGEVISPGRIRVDQDPAKALEAPLRIDVTLKGHPDVVSGAQWPIGFACPQTADFRGADGKAGGEGLAEHRAGESGRRQSDRGEDGSDGAHARAVNARVRWVARSGLLEVFVDSGDRRARYLVDPTGGSLTLDASGGDGGDGGAGGAGARGASGTCDTCAGEDGGDGGDGGRGGDGGDGGSITVEVDRGAQPWMHLLHFEQRGGAGGRGGMAGRGGIGGRGGVRIQSDPNEPARVYAAAGHSGTAGKAGHGGEPGIDGPDPLIQVLP